MALTRHSDGQNFTTTAPVPRVRPLTLAMAEQAVRHSRQSGAKSFGSEMGVSPGTPAECSRVKCFSAVQANSTTATTALVLSMARSERPVSAPKCREGVQVVLPAQRAKATGGRSVTQATETKCGGVREWQNALRAKVLNHLANHPVDAGHRVRRSIHKTEIR